MFGLVEYLIRDGEQLLSVAGFGIEERGGTGAHGYAAIVGQALRVLLEELDDPIGDFDGTFGIRAREDEREFVSAESHRMVARTDRAFEEFADEHEDFVARTVAVRVVVPFEVVEVYHDDGEIFATAYRVVDDGIEFLFEEGPIAESGESVAEGVIFRSPEFSLQAGGLVLELFFRTSPDFALAYIALDEVFSHAAEGVRDSFQFEPAAGIQWRNAVGVSIDRAVCEGGKAAERTAYLRLEPDHEVAPDTERDAEHDGGGYQQPRRPHPENGLHAEEQNELRPDVAAEFAVRDGYADEVMAVGARADRRIDDVVARADGQ